MKFYGAHGTSKEFLASGAPIPDGDYFELSKSDIADPHNLRLISECKVLAASDASDRAVKEARAELEKKNQPTNKEGGENS